MKVIHTIHSIRSEAGGPAYSVPALAKALQQEGIEVELWTCVPSAVPPQGLVTKCVEPKALAARLKEEQKAHPELIVHDHGVWLPWNHQVAKAATKAKIPRVVSPRGMLEPWAMKYRAAKKWLAWRLYQKRDLQSAALLHATAEAEAQHLRELGLTPAILVAPNGVTLPPATLLRRPTANQFRTILFISRLHPKKGLLDLVAAWSHINDPDWRIRIIGPDENNHRAEVQAAISAAGLTSCITIEPALAGSAKWQAYADADLFVLPSYSENFGLVVAEALACGTPVITTKATPWEELETNHCGWWIDTGSAALQEVLEKVIALPPDELAIMGQAGRELIAERYDWASIASSMRRAYQELL